MKNKSIILSILLLPLLFLACDPENIIPESSFKGFERPSHFPPTVYAFDKNEITEDKFLLGKKIFYDVRLSKDFTVSCGSCHIQSNAFAQFGHDVSHGVDDRLGRRNSPSLVNLAWMTNFMWDGGVVDLDLQPLAPISAHDEMDMLFDDVLDRLREVDEYKIMFAKAFGTEEISSERFLKALSQFMLLCVSANAKYDNVKQGKATFTELEERGYTFFKANCNSCHTEPLFSDFSFKNNGITPGPITDFGRFNITLREIDRYTFKVPSLRNVMLTAPYMHHGKVATIEDVLEHYNSAITNHYGTVDPSLLRTPVAIPMTNDDKEALIAFLQTLTDTEFISRTDLAE